MGKMKELYGQLQQQDMLDADYQYEQWKEQQLIEQSIVEKLNLETKNNKDGNITRNN